MSDLEADLFELSMSEQAQPLMAAVKKHIADNVEPIIDEFQALNEGKEDRWSWHPRQLELLDGAKAKAKESGLWNFFLPDADTGEGLNNLDYAYIAAELGKYPLASETLNCSAPDTGNMEVLERVGTEAQKKQWLQPLLDGEIRSAYAMTEPALPSSDAKNISTSAVLDGDEWVINGEKYYISGAGDPRCKIMITMVKTSPDAAPSRQQSQILVPIDTPGVEILGGMEVFGEDHAPRGHMHLKFNNVRVPKENILLGEGRGFEISQLRLGPGRIHHCMRSIGKAELALELLVKRAGSRTAFGKPIAKLGKNIEMISRARIEINAMRLSVLQAAKAMDVLGNKEARVYVSAVKAMVPEKVCEIIDQAIQIHGAAGVSQWTPLAGLYTDMRHLRFADGPDEVHHMVVGRAELQKYELWQRHIMTETQAETNPEGYNVGAVEDWIRLHVADLQPPFKWTRLEGGHSNLTYQLEDSCGALAVIRRPPQGQLLPKAHDMSREWALISALGKTDVPVPAAYGFCEDPEVTGAWFYVMGHVNGHPLYTSDDTRQWVPESQRRKMAMSFIDVLAQLHAVDPDEVGLGELGKKENYVGRQLKTWYRSWTSSVEPADYDDPRAHELQQYFLDHMPDQGPARVVHGDYGLHNVLIGPDHTIAAVVDWEISTLGDPLADLAYALNAWPDPTDAEPIPEEAATAPPGFPTRTELADRYAEKTGRDLSRLNYYIAFNRWKTAAIVHGVYARYCEGKKSTEGIDLDEMRNRIDRALTLSEQAIGRT